MQQRPVAVPGADAGEREPGVGGEQVVKRIKIASLYGLGCRDGTRLVRRHKPDAAAVT
jgi:hypothetical protein